MQHAAVIGWSLLVIGAFLGITALARWGGNEVEEARDRAARREWDVLMATMSGPAADSEGTRDRAAGPPTVPLPRSGDWPAAGAASLHFFGTDEVPYDPEAETAEFLRKMEADTTAFIARITGERDHAPALAPGREARLQLTEGIRP